MTSASRRLLRLVHVLPAWNLSLPQGRFLDIVEVGSAGYLRLSVGHQLTVIFGST